MCSSSERCLRNTKATLVETIFRAAGSLRKNSREWRYEFHQSHHYCHAAARAHISWLCCIWRCSGTAPAGGNDFAELAIAAVSAAIERDAPGVSRRRLDRRRVWNFVVVSGSDAKRQDADAAQIDPGGRCIDEFRCHHNPAAIRA